MVELNIASLNVRGINNSGKRRQVFHYFNIKKYDIIFLQETHSFFKMEQMWRSEWGHNIIYSHGTSNTRGVAILIKNNCSHTIHRATSDSIGRFIILDITLGDLRFTIANIYGPNEDKPEFFENFINIFESFTNEYRLIAGDFNLILHNELDKKGGKPFSHIKSQEKILDWIKNTDLVDIWRVKHPDEKSFTWSRIKPALVMCRLDFFLLSQSLISNVKETNILPGFRSDHSLINCNMSISTYRRGPGFWKLNCKLLQDKTYLDLIKKCIDETTENNKNCDPVLLWDTVKCQIRGATISFSSYLAKQKQSELSNLERRLSELKAIFENTLDENLIIEIQEVENQINDHLLIKTQGAIVRSRARYVELGEKNTKYFLNMEKRNYNSRIINKLRLKDNKVTFDLDQILNEEKTFYEKLYTSEILELDNNVCNLFLTNMPTLSHEESLSCESDLNEAEVYECILSLHDNKTPGTDGLPSEFYKIMWPYIKTLLLNCYTHIVSNNKMSITQRQGIITLIPKKDKDRELLKNWRPLSLLNTDYKIIAKCIANRIKKVLPNIIHSDQTGFLPNRFIGENINRIISLIHYSKVKKINPCLVTVDFEKAFDLLEKKYVLESLKYFNFGPLICNWINIFYNDISSCVINNGWASAFFPITRGVRQGCPLSPYLFILTVESLANRIRNCENIKGINVNGIKHVISLYADDTTLFLMGDRSSFTECLHIFHEFRYVTGLKMNLDKTEVMPLNGSCNHRKKVVESFGLRWNLGPINTLGIYIFSDIQKTTKVNYENKYENMKAAIKIWSCTIVKSLWKIINILSLIIF